MNHDEYGRALEPARSASDVEKAMAIKEQLLGVILKDGASATHSRLQHGWGGANAYPGLDEIKYISHLIGGQVVCQCGDIQIFAGSGPVLMHVLHHMVRDGQGVSAPHWSLLQAWTGVPDPDLEPEVLSSMGDLDIVLDQLFQDSPQPSGVLQDAQQLHESIPHDNFPLSNELAREMDGNFPSALEVDEMMRAEQVNTYFPYTLDIEEMMRMEQDSRVEQTNTDFHLHLI